MEEMSGKTKQPVEVVVKVAVQDEASKEEKEEEEEVAKQSWKMPVLCTIWFLATICNMFSVKIIFAATHFSLIRDIIIVQLASISLYSWAFGALWGVPENKKEVTWKRYLRLILPVALSIFIRTRIKDWLLWTTPISDPYSLGVEALYPICMLVFGRKLLAKEENVGIASTLLVAVLGGGFVLGYFLWKLHNRLQFTELVAFAMMTAFEMTSSKEIMKETGIHSTKLLSAISGLVLLALLPSWLWKLYNRILSPGSYDSKIMQSTEVIIGVFVFGALSWVQTAAAFSILSMSSVHHFLIGSGCNRIIRIVTFMLVASFFEIGFRPQEFEF